MADIKIDDLDGDEELNLQDARKIYGGEGADPTTTDPTQAPTVPIQPVDPNAPLPGQGDDPAGSAGGGGCQL